VRRGRIKTSTLKAAGAPVNDTIPKQGATGWADTWMLAANAPDPNCAYKWMAYMSTPKLQAEDAISYGETQPTAGLPHYEHAGKGRLRGVSRQRTTVVFKTNQVLEDAAHTCDNGQNVCVGFSKWQKA